MTCSEFENLLGDLVCDRLRNAMTRKQALAHAIACEACAKQVTLQRELNIRLYEFAEATRTEHPPLRTKHLVREALSELHVTPRTKYTVGSGSKFRWSQNRQVVACAATTVLLFFSISLFWQGHREQSLETTVADIAGNENVPPEVLLRHEPTSQPQPTIVAQPVTKHAVARRKQLRTSTLTKREPGFAFVPLTLGTNERALANGMLVRLEVPRAQLIALGLPLGIEADQEMVNAEVMMGEDGVAYAIRVLH